MPRVELPDGQWADLRESITHGQDKELQRARLAANRDEAEAYEFASVLVRSFLRDWYVKDPDGQPIAASDPDAVDRAPHAIVDRLARDALELYKAATVPNAPTPPSSADSSSANR